MDTRITLRSDLSQSQHLAPHVQLLIKLLHMGQGELDAFITQATLDNPLLQREDFSDTERPERIAQDGLRRDASLTISIPEKSKNFDTLRSSLEDFNLPLAASLRDHLVQQLGGKRYTPQQYYLCDAIINSLDEDGYFRIESHVFAQLFNVQEQDVMTVLTDIQSCDPVGIGARTLGECFHIQLQDQDDLFEKDAIILKHLEILLDDHPERALKKLGIAAADLQTTLAKIQRLNPKPAKAFQTSQQQHDEPDVIVSQTRNGVVVEINPLTMPRLAIDHQILLDLKSKKLCKEDLRYLDERNAHAHGLIKALQQRATTILKVATSIIDHQRAFIDFGSMGLKPLTLRMVADTIGLHESTISRVTQHKTILTPRGLFPMRYFFSSALDSVFHQDGIASSHAKNLIRTMVASEFDKPLSDDAITSRLKEEGIVLARRTVAKYREALGIAPSSERRKSFALKTMLGKKTACLSASVRS